MPVLELVDAHHHLIHLEAVNYPWIERRSPALEALLDNHYDIARDYDIDDYRADVADARLVKSVGCEFGAADPVAEARWVQRQADSRGFPHAFIAAVDLAARYDEQLPAAHELIRSFPETRIVLEAAGWPLDQTPDGFRRWEERLQAVSQFPNVSLKLQGLPLLFGASVDDLRPWVRAAVRIFGARRCMFATDFPIDRLVCSFGDLVSSLLTILGDLSAEEQSAFFSGCAIELYRLV